MPLNWKLAVDTFGETYHFGVLHRNSLATYFHGNVQAYDTYGRNHRMSLCLRSIDDLRGRPESTWHVSDGAFPVYYLFPNIQLNVGIGGLVLVRIYPDPKDTGRSISRVSFYSYPEAMKEDPVGSWTVPEQVVTPGEELWVKIIDLDLQRRRISLSIKQAAEGGVVAAEYQEHFGDHAYDDSGNYIGAEHSEGQEAWEEYFAEHGVGDTPVPAADDESVPEAEAADAGAEAPESTPEDTLTEG